jgi:hypothetical protein
MARRRAGRLRGWAQVGDPRFRLGASRPFLPRLARLWQARARARAPALLLQLPSTRRPPGAGCGAAAVLPTAAAAAGPAAGAPQAQPLPLMPPPQILSSPRLHRRRCRRCGGASARLRLSEEGTRLAATGPPLPQGGAHHAPLQLRRRRRRFPPSRPTVRAAERAGTAAAAQVAMSAQEQRRVPAPPLPRPRGRCRQGPFRAPCLGRAWQHGRRVWPGLARAAERRFRPRAPARRPRRRPASSASAASCR